MKFTLFFWVIFISTIGKAQVKLGLEEAIELGIFKSKELKQMHFNESLARHNLRSVKYSAIPSISYNNNLNFSFGRNEDPFSSQFINSTNLSTSGNISSSFSFFQWAQLKNNLALTHYEVLVTESHTDRVTLELKNSITESYLKVLYYEEMSKASKVQLKAAQQFLDHDERHFNLGNKTSADIFERKAQLSLAEQYVSSSKNSLLKAELELKHILNIDTAKTLSLAGLEVFEEIESYSEFSDEKYLYNLNADKYPAVRIASYNTLAAQKKVALSKFNFMPRLSLNASIATGYSSNRARIRIDQTGVSREETASLNFQLRDNFTQYVGLNLSMPFFNGLSNRLDIERSKINYNNALLAEEIEKEKFIRSTRASILDFRSSIANYKSSKATFEATKSAFEAMQRRYEVGLVSSSVLIQAQLNLNISEFDTIKSKYEILLLKKYLEYLKSFN